MSLPSKRRAGSNAFVQPGYRNALQRLRPYSFASSVFTEFALSFIKFYLVA